MALHLTFTEKRETRPFRKMGHVTIVNEDMVETRKLRRRLRIQSNKLIES
jgi:phosphoribosylaminoimidazole carboxylase (NCAIR synthetase)